MYGWQVVKVERVKEGKQEAHESQQQAGMEAGRGNIGNRQTGSDMNLGTGIMNLGVVWGLS